MLSLFILNVNLMSVNVLSIVMLCVVMLSIVRLGVVAPSQNNNLLLKINNDGEKELKRTVL